MQEKQTTSPAHLRIFMQNFFKHPRMLGTILPSSSYVVKRLVRQIDSQRANVVVEYGPGVGTFTREILRRMPPTGHLIAVDTNADFVRVLQQSIQDPRLTAIHGSAEDVQQYLTSHGHEAADYIVSGIPFSTMPEDLRLRILKATYTALRPTGAFLVYQYSRALEPYLNPLFSPVESEFEWRNLVPIRLFYCHKMMEIEHGHHSPSYS